jgi:hypothetical protein
MATNEWLTCLQTDGVKLSEALNSNEDALQVCYKMNYFLTTQKIDFIAVVKTSKSFEIYSNFSTPRGTIGNLKMLLLVLKLRIVEEIMCKVA